MSVSDINKGASGVNPTANSILPSQNGNSGKVLGTDGSNVSWVAGGGGGGSPGGSNTQVQFNDAGSFGGDAGFTYDKSADSLTLAGNQTFSGSAKRIIGDFTNATKSNRLSLQTSTANGTTGFAALPNGTGQVGSFFAHGGSDADNSAYAQFHCDSSGGHVGINSSKTGTGTTLPIRLQIDNTTKVSVDTSGNLNYVNATASTAAAFDSSKNLVSVTNTGTGNNVLATSPTLVTPALGTPTSGVLTNCTGLPKTTGIANWSAPTVQKFTSGSGTYTKPANVLYIKVLMVGGGAGGCGSGTSNTGGIGGAGGNTTFGTSLLVANGGSANVVPYNSGAGGTASLGTGPIGTALSGGVGDGGVSFTIASTYVLGGGGAASPLGGAAGGTIVTGVAAAPNTGSGGGGAGSNAVSACVTGAGGSAGGFVCAIILSPSATYSYAVGAAGAAGTAGTSGLVGGAGGSGYIEVTEYYQ